MTITVETKKSITREIDFRIRMTGESHVSVMHIMSGEWERQRSLRSSSLGNRLLALKERIFSSVEEWWSEEDEARFE